MVEAPSTRHATALHGVFEPRAGGSRRTLPIRRRPDPTARSCGAARRDSIEQVRTSLPSSATHALVHAMKMPRGEQQAANADSPTNDDRGKLVDRRLDEPIPTFLHPAW